MLLIWKSLEPPQFGLQYADMPYSFALRIQSLTALSSCVLPACGCLPRLPRMIIELTKICFKHLNQEL